MLSDRDRRTFGFSAAARKHAQAQQKFAPSPPVHRRFAVCRGCLSRVARAWCGRRPRA